MFKSPSSSGLKNEDWTAPKTLAPPSSAHKSNSKIPPTDSSKQNLNANPLSNIISVAQNQALAKIKLNQTREGFSTQRGPTPVFTSPGDPKSPMKPRNLDASPLVKKR